MPVTEYFFGNISVITNHSLILAITWIIETNPATILLGHYASNQVKRFQHEDIIEATLQRWERKQEQLMENQTRAKFIIEVDNFYDENQNFFEFSDQLSVEEISYYFHAQKNRAIWLLDNMESFAELVIDLLNERNHYRISGQYWIIYTSDAAFKRRIADIELMFQTLFSIYALNVNILIEEEGTIFVYTYYPFQENNCKTFKPQIHLTLTNLNEFGEYEVDADIPLFANKLENMWQCKLKVVTWPYKPFMSIESDYEKANHDYIHGIEGLIIRLLADTMNFSMEIVEPPTRDRGYRFPNGTTTGAIKMIADGDANVTLLCITIDKMRSMVTWASYPYMYIPLVVGIPAGRPLSPFIRLIRPFKYIIWSCLSASIIFGILIIFLVKWKAKRSVRAFLFGRRNRKPFTNFLRALYGMPAHGELPYGNFARYIFALWLLYTSVFRNTYTAQLLLIMQDGRSIITVKTLQELVALNYTFITFPTLFKAITETAKSRPHIQFLGSSLNEVEILLNNINDENSHYVITLLHYVLRAYNQRQSEGKRKVKILPQKLITSPISMYLRKHSYLLDPFNDLLLLIMSSGFISHFKNKYLDPLQSSRDANDTEPDALSVWLLSGLFGLHLVLLTLCFAIFLLELYSVRSKKLRKLINFFNY